MLINISVGSANFPPLRSGDVLLSQESEGLTQVVESVQDGIGEVRKLVGHVDDRLQVVLSDEVAHDLKRVVHSSANVMEGIERGQGLLHRVIYDPQLARSGTALLADAQKSAQRLNLALGRVDDLLAAVATGNGTLHGLLYRDEGGKLLAQAQAAITELTTLLAEVRTGRGTAHALIYEPAKTDLVADLGATARILHTLAEEAAQGKGTVGGLLRDPSIYQDLKLTLDHVQRNALLKALVRAAIQSEGLRRDGSSK
jgi:phospholipid/cholesterol/gamma-HCH transport system substrate-binding protein